MLWALLNLKHNLWNSRQNPPRKYIIFYAQKNFSKKLFFRLKKIAFCKKSLTYHLAREYVPLPHVFPPFAIRKTLRVGTLDAIDFVAIAIPSLRSLHRAHIKRRRLIMSLVALVQNNQSAPATAYFCLVLGVRFLVAAAPRVPSSKK